MAGYDVRVAVAPINDNKAPPIQGRANRVIGDFDSELEAQNYIDVMQDILTHASYITLYTGGRGIAPSITELWVPEGVIKQSVISFRIEHA